MTISADYRRQLLAVSDKGQVVIPATIRRRLGLGPGSKLDFELEGDSIRVRPLKSIPPSLAEDGYGLLRCDLPGERRLADFDVADAMRHEQMIALDTNILARFYVDDPNDPEAAKQRPVAQRILTERPSLFVPITVVLELEWVLRAFYHPF